MKTINKIELTNLFFSNFEKSSPFVQETDIYDWINNNFNTYDDENEWYGVKTELHIITSVFLSMLNRGITVDGILKSYKESGYNFFKNVMVPIHQLTLPSFTEMEVK